MNSKFLEVFLFLLKRGDFTSTDYLCMRFGIHKRTVYRYLRSYASLEGIKVFKSRRGYVRLHCEYLTKA